MKIIFLNCWNGKIREPFFDFIKIHSKDTDIICLQEVNKKLHKDISTILPNFVGLESHKLVGFRQNYEISVFTSRNIKLKNYRINIINNKEIGDCLTVELNDFVLCVVHGIAQPGNKFDTTDRIHQSRLILESLPKNNLPVIIGGDFNLMPNTKSIKLIENAGFENLIRKFKIKETRNRFAWNTFKNLPDYVQQHYADYCFVSKDVKVKKFTVPKVEISDHLPLILEFDI
jgi:endonuclease/exonuclease/phosphatase family metal-dependent hydrolase